MDTTLIQRAQVGDQQAFQRLVEAYNDVARRTTRVLIKDPTIAEDALQDAWIDAWRGLPQFQLGRPFRPWLLTIVANRCRRIVKHRQLSLVPLDSVETDHLTDEKDGLSHLLQMEKKSELHIALSTLNAEQNQTLELRYFAELELAEIAMVTHTPLGTVKSRLNRSLAILRAHLNRQQSPQQDQAISIQR